MRVVGHPDYGLPFGLVRLLLIWIANMATWQKSRVIRFRSATAILEAFGLPKEGRYYRRLITSFERIFYFASDQQDGDAVLIERQSFRFVKDARLWYFESQSPQSSQSKAENVIVLSEKFLKEIQEHPIPVDLTVVKALADSPGNLDLYVRLAWRCWTAKCSVSVPLFGPEGLDSLLGISENLRQRDFCRQIVHWLKVIQQLWSECPVTLTGTRAYSLIKAARRSLKISTASRDFNSAVHVTEFAHST